MRFMEAHKPVCIHHRPCPGALRDTIDPVLLWSTQTRPLMLAAMFGHGVQRVRT